MNLLTINNTKLIGFDIYYFFKYYQKEIGYEIDSDDDGLLFIYDQFFPFQMLQVLANKSLNIQNYLDLRINYLCDLSSSKIKRTKKIYFFYTYTFYSKYDYDFDILKYIKERIESKLKREVIFILNNHLADDNYHHFNTYRYDVYNHARENKKIKNNDKKEKIFICLNAKQRKHRDDIYEFINNEKINNLFYFSYIYKNIFLTTTKDYQTFAKKYISNEDSSAHKAFEYYLDDDLFSTKKSFLFDQSYYYIATETSNADNLCFMGEKTYKAIYHKIPFIILGNPYSLKYLKLEGFKTFDKWIDESYDFEIDYEKRKKIIFDEIKRLASLPINEHDKNISEMDEILEYNYNHFMNISNIKNDFLKIL